MEKFNINRFTGEIAEQYRKNDIQGLKERKKEIFYLLNYGNIPSEQEEHLKVIEPLLDDKISEYEE